MPRSRFLSAVLRPISGDSEVGVDARRSLEEKLDGVGPDASLLEEAAARFEAVGERPRVVGRVLRFALFAGAAAMLFWPTTIRTERDLVRAQRIAFQTFQRPFGPIPGPLSESEAEDCLRFLFPNATGDQKLLLAADSAARAEALWRERGPEDPALYYHFARRRLRNSGDLPPDFLDVAEKLDPDNAYPLMLKAGNLGIGCVKRQIRPAGSFSPSLPSIKRPLSTFSVEDEKKFTAVLGLFAEAAKRPQFENRRSEILRRCAENPTPPGDDAGAITRIVRAGWIRTRVETGVDVLGQRHVFDVVSARAAQLEAAGDKEGLAELARQWLDFMPKAVRGKSSFFDMLILRDCIDSSGRQLMKSCRALGLEDEARRIEAPVAAVCARSDARRRFIEKSEGETEALLCRAGFLARRELSPGLLNETCGEVQVEPMDLTSDRLADYTMSEFLAAHAGVLGFMAAAGIAGFGMFRWGKPVRVLGKRMAEGLSVGDWAWIVALGILAPLAWYGFVTRIPGFHAREVFIHIPVEQEFPFPKGLKGFKGVKVTMSIRSYSGVNLIADLQCLAAFLLVLTATLQTVRWRVRLRGRVVGFGRGRIAPWFGWSGPLAAALALPACSIPAIAFEAGGKPDPRNLLPAAILLGYAALWMFAVFVRALAGRSARGLERATVARALVPAFLCAAIAFGIGCRLAAAEHRRWMALDPFCVLSPQYDGQTKYEYMTTRWIQEGLVEAFCNPGKRQGNPSSGTRRPANSGNE